MNNLKVIKNVLEEDLTSIGILDSDETVGINPSDLVGNMLVLGASGTGKSIFVENIVIADLFHGRGGLLIEPHGDLIDDCKPYGKNGKIVVFEVSEDDAQTNIDRFNKEIDLSKMKEGMFVMCKLSYKLVGNEVARDVGKYILDQFNKLDDLENLTLAVDEYHNFVDDEVSIVNNKEKGVRCILADQDITYYAQKTLEKILSSTDHTICFTVREPSAKAISDKFGMDKEELKNVEKYHFYARLNVGGELGDTFHAKSVFPLPYPKNA